MSVHVVNPLNALKEVTDFQTGKTSSGEKLGLPSDVREFRAAGTIAKGDIVALVGPTSATDPGGVVAQGGAVADMFAAVKGVAEGSAVAGEVVSVCTYGLTFVNVGTGAPVDGNRAVIAATDAQADVVATIEDATTVVGSTLGIFWGAKDANNLAPVFVDLR